LQIFKDRAKLELMGFFKEAFDYFRTPKVDIENYRFGQLNHGWIGDESNGILESTLHLGELTTEELNVARIPQEASRDIVEIDIFKNGIPVPGQIILSTSKAHR